jgi:hypothetical protein
MMKKLPKRIGRRKFLSKVALSVAASPLAVNAQKLPWWVLQPPDGTRPAPAPAPPPEKAPAAATGKRPLTQADFEYVGVMRVPEEVSAFSVGAMTARKVGANIQFLDGPPERRRRLRIQ